MTAKHDMEMVKELATEGRAEWGVDYGPATARVLCRIVAMLGAMGLDVLDDEQGTPTPADPTPAERQEGTSMERSMAGQQDKHPPPASEKKLRNDPWVWGSPKHWLNDVVVEEHTPRTPENFYLGGPTLGDWNMRDGTIGSPPSAVPENFFGLPGSAAWDATCGLDRPVGYSVDDRVDVVLRDWSALMDRRVGGLNWHECGSGSIIRYRRRAGADVKGDIHVPAPECLGDLRVYGGNAGLSQSEYAAGQGVPSPASDPVLPEGWKEWNGRWKQRWSSGLLATDFIDVFHRDGSISENVCVDAVTWTWSSVRGSPQDRDVLGWRRHVPFPKLEVQKTHEGFMPDPDNGPDGVFGPDVVEDVGREKLFHYELSGALLRAAEADGRVPFGRAMDAALAALRSSGLI